MVSAILLAAGEGQRMGKPKALMELNGRVLLELLSSRLTDLDFQPVIVVTTPPIHEEVIRRKLLSPSIQLITNPHPENGQLSSIRLGLQTLDYPGRGCLLLPVDHPFVRNDTLQKLRENAVTDKILIPTFQNKRGHPPLFGSKHLTLLHSIPLSEGARGIYRRLPSAVQELETTDPGVLLNANTPEDWERGLRLFAAKNQPEER